MKKIIYFLFLLLAVTFLASCNNVYEGKEIESIDYVSINYLGGNRSEYKIDFKANVVLFRSYQPVEVETVPEYEVLYTFSNEDKKEFIDELNKSGFLNLDDEYPSPGGIMDGGGWEVNISYYDKTVKASTGDNNFPIKIFKKADYAFYNLYGEDIFGTIPSSYKFPPHVDIAYCYSYDTTNVSDGTSLGSTNATWNKYKKEDINNIEYAITNQKYSFLEKYGYEFTLWTANYEFRFSNLEIKSYDLEGNDEKLIISTKWFKQKEFEIVFDRVYVITITYPNGICEYAFATKLNSTNSN